MRIRKFLEEKLKWIAALALLAGMIYGSYTLSRYVTGEAVGKQETEVVVDVGHGGGDPGKVGINHIQEKDINLKIALKVKKKLEKQKITVMLTRETDEALGDSASGSRKVEDMKARVKMINEIKPQLAVSIHQNSYQSEEIKGAQVFYYSHSAEGEQLAKTMQEALLAVNPENHRQAKPNESYYLLKRTEVPTIIVECGFLTNPEEAGLLAQDEYQDQVAEAIVNGITACLKKEK